MKQKTHKGLQKRVKIRKSGTIRVQKSCKNHLLSNKSKRQKKSGSTGLVVSPGHLKAVKKKLGM
ncbi:50S ribosomal protein L35 [Candidatus Peregrinibacteria bacterium]|nr:50S ribosomal protein L35 [Candidatus Peregrinibacteria bacterium]MBT4056180.1 50S ribosomal protein L35 [Candidatus Peregrinibacteria bacterium]